MPPKPRTPEYWDDWYANQAETPTVAEVMNRHLGLPPDLQAGIVPAAAIPEITSELRLRPGDTLLDLACGRSGYGLTVARNTGAPVRVRSVDLAAGLAEAGFTGIEVRQRPAWLELERDVWNEAVTIDPGDDPALISFHDEGVRSLELFTLIRRVLAVATVPVQ
jgi:hypothetical protein